MPGESVFRLNFLAIYKCQQNTPPSACGKLDLTLGQGDKSSQRNGHVCWKVSRQRKGGTAPGPAVLRRDRGRSPCACPQIWALLATSSRRDTPWGRKSQLSFLPDPPPAETVHPLTNGFDDAAILELGPIQRGQSLQSRRSQLILEKTPSKTTCHGQPHWVPRTAGLG